MALPPEGHTGMWLHDLKISQHELRARVIEGLCPGCGRRLERRAVTEVCSQTHGPECGWCELCLWGWSTKTWRAEDGSGYEPGEQIVTCYTAGALATAPD